MWDKTMTEDNLKGMYQKSINVDEFRHADIYTCPAMSD